MLSTQPLQRLMGEQAPRPLLTREEEIALAQRVATGHSARRQLAKRRLSSKRRRALRRAELDGIAAREALVLHNLRLVLNIAGRFRNESLTYDDLVQEGVIGLLKAADRYDPKRGTRFATFAVWWIRQAIGRAIANHGRTIRLPVNRVYKIGQLRRAAAQMAQAMGDAPPIRELAERVGLLPHAASAMLQDSQDVISLDAPIAPDARDTLERMADSSTLVPESAVAERSLIEVLEESLARLDEREAEILRLRFGLGGGEARPLRSIAAEWHMSPEGVRQIGERAISHLRAMPDVQALSEYLH